ncbi:MAG: hypothetical protein HYW48_06840 [Deltaproteobacteria bacterium]|nr:hypothetical protein [Deltaproteobacteria bacterium]
MQDFAAYCEQLLLSDEGGEDRPNSLRQIAEQFLPGDVIDMAYRAEKHLPSELQHLEEQALSEHRLIGSC